MDTRYSNTNCQPFTYSHVDGNSIANGYVLANFNMDCYSLANGYCHSNPISDSVVDSYADNDAVVSPFLAHRHKL